MRRPGIAALTTLVLFALTTPSHADGIYFTESFGGTRFRDEFGAWTDGGVRIRAGLGWRFTRFSVEAWLGADVGSEIDYAQEPEPFTYGLDLKYAFPVYRGLEAYVRGSMSRMEVDTGLLNGFGGRGLGVGTGLQLKGRVPLITLLYLPSALICLVPDICRRYRGPKYTAALFVDQGYDFYRLHAPDGGGSIDAVANRWTLGFAIGTDF